MKHRALPPEGAVAAPEEVGPGADDERKHRRRHRRGERGRKSNADRRAEASQIDRSPDDAAKILVRSLFKCLQCECGTTRGEAEEREVEEELEPQQQQERDGPPAAAAVDESAAPREEPNETEDALTSLKRRLALLEQQLQQGKKPGDDASVFSHASNRSVGSTRSFGSKSLKSLNRARKKRARQRSLQKKKKREAKKMEKMLERAEAIFEEEHVRSIQKMRKETQRLLSQSKGGILKN